MYSTIRALQSSSVALQTEESETETKTDYPRADACITFECLVSRPHDSLVSPPCSCLGTGTTTFCSYCTRPMLPTALITFISSAVLAFAAPQKHLSETPTLAFQLRHIHGVSPDNTIVFADVDRSVSIASTGALRARTRNVSVHRPKSQEAFHRARHRSARDHESTLLGWDEDEIMGPDVEDKETVLMLAQMTSNAYLNPGEKGWYEVGEHWNVVRHLRQYPVPHTQADDLSLELSFRMGA
jgi:hypothetical protein